MPSWLEPTPQLTPVSTAVLEMALCLFWLLKTPPCQAPCCYFGIQEQSAGPHWQLPRGRLRFMSTNRGCLGSRTVPLTQHIPRCLKEGWVFLLWPQPPSLPEPCSHLPGASSTTMHSAGPGQGRRHTQGGIRFESKVFPKQPMN